MWSGGQGDRQARSDSAGGGRRAVVPQAAVPKAADASACGGSHGTSLSLSAAASHAITSQSFIKAALACSVLQRGHQARPRSMRRRRSCAPFAPGTSHASRPGAGTSVIPADGRHPVRRAWPSWTAGGERSRAAKYNFVDSLLYRPASVIPARLRTRLQFRLARFAPPAAARADRHRPLVSSSSTALELHPRRARSATRGLFPRWPSFCWTR